MWIFGYGSLIWRPNIEHVERLEGAITGWQRRFWQGSPDHRGTPERPGRVVTLVERPRARCLGVAYRLPADKADVIMARLDHREQAGYRRIDVQVEPPEGSPVTAVCYIAGPANPCWLGPAPLGEMAAQIANSTGPSGPNAEYLVRLAAALREMRTRHPSHDGADHQDRHVDELDRAFRELLEPGVLSK